MAQPDDIHSSSYRLLKYLLQNQGKLVQNTEIALALGVRRSSLSYTSSRIKDFIMNSGECENVFKVIIRGRTQVYFKCIAEGVIDVDSLALEYLEKYREFNREYERKKRFKINKLKPNTKPDKPVKPMTDTLLPDLSKPTEFTNLKRLSNTGGTPIDVPINIAIKVSVAFRKA